MLRFISVLENGLDEDGIEDYEHGSSFGSVYVLALGSNFCSFDPSDHLEPGSNLLYWSGTFTAYSGTKKRKDIGISLFLRPRYAWVKVE